MISPEVLERLDVLEKINAALLERVQELEERVKKPETAPEPALAPAPTPAPAQPITFNSAALKTGLFDKMWKHLNDR